MPNDIVKDAEIILSYFLEDKDKFNKSIEQTIKKYLYNKFSPDKSILIFITYLVKEIDNNEYKDIIDDVFTSIYYLTVSKYDTTFKSLSKQYPRIFEFFLNYLSVDLSKIISSERRRSLFIISYLITKFHNPHIITDPNVKKVFEYLLGPKSDNYTHYFIKSIEKSGFTLPILDLLMDIPKNIFIILESLDYESKIIEENEKIYIKKDKKPNRNKNLFLGLKKYNSAFPALLNGVKNEENTGGGFFIDWEGFGIVIDPGYTYFKQFKENGYDIADIDCIFVSHVHEDHCYDLEKIFSVLYKYNKFHSTASNNRKKIVLFGSENVYNKYRFLSNPYFISVFPLYKNHNCKEANKILQKNKLPINVQTFDAFHHEKPITLTKYGTSIGFEIKLKSKIKGGKNKKILYTGDTAFKEELIEQYLRSNADLWILNIGKLEVNQGDHDSKHLGFMGCIDLIMGYLKRKKSPKLILISEWGAELKDLRIVISDYIYDWIKAFYPQKAQNLKILPIDNTLKINLDTLEIAVNTSGIEQYVIYKKVKANFSKDKKHILYEII